MTLKLLVFVLVLYHAIAFDFPFQNPALPWDQRVADLVGRLTLEEKVAQMSHGGAENNGPAPAIPRLQINPYQFGTECLRGDVQINATAFPQSLGLAATFSPATIYAMARATSDEVRAKNNYYVEHNDYGFHKGLSCWSPVINIFRDPLWGRGQETYGECPFVNGILAHNYVKGLQGTDPRYVEAVAGCKHFSVFGGPSNNAMPTVTERDWRTTFLPQFKRCVEAGSWSLMCSYSVINGVPACANSHLLTDILRNEWKFPGYVVSDQAALEGVANHLHVDWLTAAAKAANAGCCLEDANMQDNVFSNLVTAVNQGLVTNDTINDAVSRLFMARMHLGEFDPVEMVPYKKINISVVDSPAHRRLAQLIATQTFVLLKNENILPLKIENLKTVAVIGPQSNNSNTIFGDYSPTPVITITPLQGIQDALKSTSVKVLYTEGCDIACTSYDPTDVVNTAKQADVVILFMGICTDQEREGHDRTTLDLPGNQLLLIKDVVATGKPVVLVLLNAGPLDVTWPQDNVHAILEAFYPAQATGSALADVLFGLISPAGRLPVTWPMSLAQVPPMDNYTMEGRTYRYWTWSSPLYPFGYGLSYTTFQYSDLKLSTTSLKPCSTLTVSATVKNTGTVSSDEVIQVYISWKASKIPSPIIQLVGFDRVHIIAGSSASVSFDIEPTDIALWLDETNLFVLEPGTFDIWIGGQQPNQERKAPSNVLNSSFELVGVRTPLSQC